MMGFVLKSIFIPLVMTVTLAGLAVLLQDVAQAAGHQTTQFQSVQVLSRLDALKASEGRIVLHYGDGIDGADQIADILTKDGRPAVAYAGGPSGQVELFINKKPPLGKYNQHDIDSGFLGGTASRFYDEFVGSGSAP